MSGILVYEGPSRLDGRPILGIVTGETRNPKTGAMLQLWIIPADVAPTLAIQTGQDRAVCGECPHRKQDDGRRTCYVNPMGLASVWRAYQAGKYPTAAQVAHRRRYRRTGGPDRVWRQFLSGRPIRLGAYGDPAALPVALLKRLTRSAGHWSGYTHQWRRFPGLRRYVMASVDSVEEYQRARALGWRTFRVQHASESLQPGEITCPASEEAGKRTTCVKCGLCDGVRRDADQRKTIAIRVHGTSARFFGRRAV